MYALDYSLALYYNYFFSSSTTNGEGTLIIVSVFSTVLDLTAPRLDCRVVRMLEVRCSLFSFVLFDSSVESLVLHRHDRFCSFGEYSTI
jgi:hypothetical protein